MGSRLSAGLVVAATFGVLSLTSVAAAHPGKGGPRPKHPHGTTTTTAPTTSTTTGSTTTTVGSTTTTTASTTTTTAPSQFTSAPTPTAADGVGPGDWIEITQGAQTF